MQNLMDSEMDLLGRARVDFTKHKHAEAPQQSNGWDCGVFVLSTVACLAGGVDIAQQPPPFRQRDMPTLRRRIALALYSARGAYTRGWPAACRRPRYCWAGPGRVATHSSTTRIPCNRVRLAL